MIIEAQDMRAMVRLLGKEWKRGDYSSVGFYAEVWEPAANESKHRFSEPATRSPISWVPSKHSTMVSEVAVAGDMSYAEAEHALAAERAAEYSLMQDRLNDEWGSAGYCAECSAGILPNETMFLDHVSGEYFCCRGCSNAFERRTGITVAIERTIA